MGKFIRQYHSSIIAFMVLIGIAILAIAFTNEDETNANARKAIIQAYELEAWKIAGNCKSKNQKGENNSIAEIKKNLGVDFNNISAINYFDDLSVGGEPVSLKGTIDKLKGKIPDCDSMLDSLLAYAQKDIFWDCYQDGNKDSKSCIYKKTIPAIKNLDDFYLTFYTKMKDAALKDVNDALKVVEYSKEYEKEKKLQTLIEAKNKIKEWKENSPINNDSFEYKDVLDLSLIWTDLEAKKEIQSYILNDKNEIFFMDLLSEEIKILIEKARLEYENGSPESLKEALNNLTESVDQSAKSWFISTDYPLKKDYRYITFLWIGIAIGFIFGVLLIALGLYVFGYKLEKKNTAQNQSPTVSPVNAGLGTSKVTEERDEYKRKYENLLKDDEYKARIIENLQKEKKEWQEKAVESEQRKSLTEIKPPNRSVMTTFYSTHPDTETGFSLAKLSQNPDDGYYFKILQLSEKDAEYELFPDPEIQIAAALSANSILKDACEYENLPRDIQSGILTVQKGQLKRTDTEWSIVKKARIRFI